VSEPLQTGGEFCWQGNPGLQASRAETAGAGLLTCFGVSRLLGPEAWQSQLATRRRVGSSPESSCTQPSRNSGHDSKSNYLNSPEVANLPVTGSENLRSSFLRRRQPVALQPLRLPAAQAGSQQPVQWLPARRRATRRRESQPDTHLFLSGKRAHTWRRQRSVA